MKPLLRYAFLAQLVEQLTRNEQVVGSSPMEGSAFSKQQNLNHKCQNLSVWIITNKTNINCLNRLGF